MKTLNFSSDAQEINSILSRIKEAGHRITLWQIPESGPRLVNSSQLTNIHAGEKLYFLANKSGKQFVSGTIYFYCKQMELIFKSILIDYVDDYSVQFPQEIKVLGLDDRQIMQDLDAMANGTFDEYEKNQMASSVSFNNDLNIHRDDVMVGRVAGTEKLGPDIVKKDLSHAVVGKYEDKVWANHREAPRTKIEGQRRVTLKKIGDPSDAIVYPLFDLSQGGMAFVVKVKELFVKDDLIEVVSLDKKELNPPLQGKVASVRPMQDSFEFKVGVMFLG